MQIKTGKRIRSSHLIAGGVALVALLWVLSGQIGGSESPANPPPANGVEQAERPLVKVRVRHQTAQTHVQEMILRGRTEASRAVDLKAETNGQVVAIAADEGGTVAEGQLLVELSHDQRDATLAEARALVRQRQIEYAAARKLAAKGFRSETSVAESKAQRDAALAALKAIEIDIGHTALLAPFAGILERRYVEIGDFVDVGDEVAQIMDLDPLFIVVNVSEQNLEQIVRGSTAFARLASGQKVEGFINYVAASAAPETRTFRVEISVPNPERALPDGVSAEVRLEVDQVRAHRVSPAILTLDDRGVIGVKIVNAENVVEFHPVAIASDDADGIWLTGLPETVDLITVGQEFVKDGQRVEPVAESAPPTS